MGARSRQQLFSLEVFEEIIAISGVSHDLTGETQKT
jgi:hypothetical protein